MSHEANDLLRAAREAAGLTQGQLAEMANAQVEAATQRLGAMDADYVGKLERGIHHCPTGNTGTLSAPYFEPVRTLSWASSVPARA